MCSDNLQKGSATLLTLLISAVIITVGVSFNWLVKEHLKAAIGLKEKSEAMVRARSAYEGLIYGMLSGTVNRDAERLPEGEWLPGVAGIPLNGSGVIVGDNVTARVQDTNGMLSLFKHSFNAPVFKRLIAIVDPGKQGAADVITDSFLDWTDEDKLARLNGAEDAYYMFEGRPYKPRNYAVQYKTELALIRGMDEGLYLKLDPFITLLANWGFNPNTASDEVLMSYMNIDRRAVGIVRAYMMKRPIMSDGELFPLIGRRISVGEGVYYLPSRLFEVTLSAGKPRPLYTIKAGVDLRMMPNAPYSVVYWKEE